MVFIGQSQIHGKGLFTDTHIKFDEQICLIADTDRKARGQDWISGAGNHVNHQKNGNTILKLLHGNEYYLYAIRDIYAGEELTSDYTKAPNDFNHNVTGYKEIIF